MPFGEDSGYRQRVGYIRIPAHAELAIVCVLGDLVGRFNLSDVLRLHVPGDSFRQLGGLGHGGLRIGIGKSGFGIQDLSRVRAEWTFSAARSRRYYRNGVIAELASAGDPSILNPES